MFPWIRSLLDCIFPRYCCLCGEFLKDTPLRYLCPFCTKKIIYIGQNTCAKCGYDFGEAAQKSHTLCPRCLNFQFHFIALRSAVCLNFASRKLIHLLKYKNNLHLASDLAKIMYDNPFFANFIRDSILVPVPLHWRRRFQREDNQSELLAKALENLPLNIKVIPLLRRIRHTRPQVELHATERKSNVRDAFEIAAKLQINTQAKLIIFDDVFTTGATIDECCKTLQAHGFHNIYAATFAQTIRH